MQSKSKPAQTVAERAHVARLHELPCAVCKTVAAPLEIHEIKQGAWFTSIPLCADCHRGSKNGLHGQRGMWRLYKMDELDALNETLRMLAANDAR
mgnify:CR=1 FL=1